MFHKNHFFNLIGYVLILLIFIQNYFDKLYMRITIIWVVLSVLLDFLWLIVHAEVILENNIKIFRIGGIHIHKHNMELYRQAI